MTVQPSRKIYAITVFLILLTCYGYFMPKWADWGANSRANLVYALGDKGVLYIDDYHQNTGDKACYPGPYDVESQTCQGRYYTDKSLGPSLVALPFYLIFRGFAALPPVESFIESGRGFGGFEDTLNPEGEGVRSEAVYQGMALVFITFFATSVPSALLGTTVFLFAARFTPRDFYAFILALAYGLATIAFPYSNVLYQHQLAAFGAFVGFYLLWCVIYENASLNWLWLVGVLFGLTTITEYPVVPFLGVIFLWAAFKMPNRLALYRVVLGAIPLGLIFAAYNYAIFGTPMPVGYEYSTNWQEVHQTGFMSLTSPTLDRLYGLTFSPFRGIFLLSPFLLLTFPGLYWMWREKPEQRSTTVALMVVIAGFFLYNAASIMWHGGFTVGPRYFVPALPFMALPIIFSFNRWLPRLAGRIIISLLILAGGFNVWIQTISGQAFPPVEQIPIDVVGYNTVNPLMDYSLPLLLQNNIARNYGIIAGLPGVLSLIPLFLAITAILVVMLYILPRRQPHQPSQKSTFEQVTETLR
jgi:hypothetical protein